MALAAVWSGQENVVPLSIGLSALRSLQRSTFIEMVKLTGMVVMAWIGLNLLQQNGRLLLRLFELESIRQPAYKIAEK